MYILKVTEEQLAIIDSALCARPYGEVAQMMSSSIQQVNEQKLSAEAAMLEPVDQVQSV